MSFTNDEIKRNLQGFFTEDIPGMGELTKELIEKVPYHINLDNNILWQNIVSDLKEDKGLEEALLKKKPNVELEEIILPVTSRYIKDFENRVINDVISGKKVLRFSKYISKMHIPNSGLSIITTNYDRLIEVSCEVQGYPVDNMFFREKYWFTG